MQTNVVENIKVALRSIRSQLLRTIITVMIIAVGISALVGILTAIDCIKSAINSEFAMMGANTFTIRNKGLTVRIGKGGQRPKRFRAVTYDECRDFISRYDYPSVTSVATFASHNAIIRYKSYKSNPNITVWGSDENYIKTAGYELEAGRNFTKNEILNNAHAVIIGKELADNIFPKEEAISKTISIGPGKYQVIGVLKAKGSSVGFGGDKMCIIPVSNVQQYFSRPNMSYTVSVMVNSPEEIEPAIGAATALFRIIRKVPVDEEPTFDISRSDNLASILIDNIKYVTVAATIIGFITLLGAAIGLMNIMLVSVTERTREIGTRKAIGATPQLIKWQFLIEAITICQLGGILGIILGILIGNITSLLLGTSFIVPWLWMFSGILLCFMVGITAGYYPANKASKLDPIEALRYE
jgi:putative ABC transport system permease protein